VPDGQRMLVSTLIKQPAIVPTRLLQMSGNQFIVDSILRPGPRSATGVVLFNESTPLFPDGQTSVIEEFGEIPVVSSSLGQPRTVRAVRRGYALKISQDMIDEENFDAVNTRMVQMRNGMRRDWEDAFLAALFANPLLQQVTATTTWGSASSTIRKDTNAARFAVENAAADQAGLQKFEFVPDTLVISTTTKTDFLDSDEVNKIYVGNIADKSLLYTGTMPNKFQDLDVMVSWRLPAGKALLLERKTVGFITDKRPLRATNLYERQETETWRSDMTRASAIGIDQPLAACVINGVDA